MFGVTPVVKNIIKLNVGFFILQWLTDATPYSISRWLSLYDYRAMYFGVWQYVTHIFLHADFFHLLFNMLPVLVLGPYLERLLGQKRFFIFYMLVGILAGVATNLLHVYENNQILQARELVAANLSYDNVYYLLRTVNESELIRNAELLLRFQSTPDDVYVVAAVRNLVERVTYSSIDIPMLGASGAVFGVLMAAALYFPNMQLILFPIPVPIRLKWLVLFYAFAEFYAGVKPVPGDNVAHFAHLSGMLFALIFYYVWKRKGIRTQKH